MEHIKSYFNSSTEIARGIMDISKKNGVSSADVNEVYNTFSRNIYLGDDLKRGLCIN